MGERRNEVVLHALGAGDFLGHAVDAVAQLADFVVVGFLQAHAIAPRCNFAHNFVDADNRFQNRFDKVAVGQQHQRDEQHAGKDCEQDNLMDLPLGNRKGRNDAQPADQISVFGEQGGGAAHHALTGERVLANPGGIFHGGKRFFDIAGRGDGIGGQAGGGKDDAAVLVQKLYLKLVLGFIFHHIAAGGGIELVIAAGPIIAEGCGGGIDPPL